MKDAQAPAISISIEKHAGGVGGGVKEPARRYGLFGRSAVVLVWFTCPAITVVTVILRALDRVRETVLGLLCRSITRGHCHCHCRPIAVYCCPLLSIVGHFRSSGNDIIAPLPTAHYCHRPLPGSIAGDLVYCEGLTTAAATTREVIGGATCGCGLGKSRVELRIGMAALAWPPWPEREGSADYSQKTEYLLIPWSHVIAAHIAERCVRGEADDR